MILFILLRIDCYLMMLYCLGIMERVMRNLKEEVEVKMTSKDVQHKPEAQSNKNEARCRAVRGSVCHMSKS